MLMHALISARPDLCTGTSVCLQKGRAASPLTTHCLSLLFASALLPCEPNGSLDV